MFNKKNLTIPNLLSGYRLFAFPVILYFLLKKQEDVFVILLIINLITDILDGFLARLLHQQTELGARLDSIADDGTYLLAIGGIFIFKYSDFEPHLFSFGVFIFLFLAANSLAILKFHRMPSLHLYSWKIGGYLQGFFFFTLFVFGFWPMLYYFVIGWGILAFLEHIVIQLIIKEMKSNAKGIYWILKEKNGK